MTKVVFMGDSITEYIPYVFKGQVGSNEDEIKYFGVENIGVGNYMRYCWPHVDHENVDYYVLLIGINNISRPDCDYDNRETLDELKDKFKEFINLIVKSNSGKLVVQSIYPTKSDYRKEDIINVNSFLKDYCEANDIVYLDIYSLLKTSDDYLDDKYTDDGIHPNHAGYELILSEISTHLNLSTEHIKKKTVY